MNDESRRPADLVRQVIDDAPPQPAAFRIVALLVPRRVCAEELGDALEMIDHLYRVGAPRWHVRLRVGSAVFWVMINTIRHLVAAVLGRELNKAG